MPINFRILGLVAFFLIIAFLGVVAVRSNNETTNWIESVPAHGQTSASPVEAGLALAVHDRSIELSVPNCDATPFSEKFFLHIYPQATQHSLSNNFINMDFLLAQEQGKPVTIRGHKSCRYKKNFNGVHAQSVVIGQFSTPNGQCCHILWSRTFFPSINK